MDQITYKPKAFVRVHHTTDRTRPTEYRPLRFRLSPPVEGLERRIALEWINYLRDTKIHPKPLSKQSSKRLDVNICWTAESGERQSSQTTYARVLQVIREHKYFAPELLGLPLNAKIPWADRGIAATMDQYWPDNQNKIQGDTTLVVLDIGDNFPLKANIDREGFCYAPLLKVLYSAVLNSRKYLVENSNQIFGPEDLWLQNLFTYFNSVISLIESLLVQIYYKAKYEEKNQDGLGRESGLKFDEATMGGTITGRALDKLHWLYLCAGRHLEIIDEEMRQIKMIKEVRNHVNHFDPPIFACTAEDVMTWLNVTAQVGSFIWKVRRLLNLPPSQDLCSILFAPEVEFVARHPDHIRGAQKPGTGYASSRWPASARSAMPAPLSAEQCRGARAMLGWTQDQLASATNLEKAVIEKFENGNSTLSTSQRETLLRVFKSARITFLLSDEHGEGIRFLKR